jgi:hypothetical protein
MPIRIMQDRARGIRVIKFTGKVLRDDLEALAPLYLDRDFYRFADRELVLFEPPVSMAAIDIEDIGLLADSYIEALRERGDQAAVLSAWVMNETVRAEIRLWWEFTREHSVLREPRSSIRLRLLLPRWTCRRTVPMTCTPVAASGPSWIPSPQPLDSRLVNPTTCAPSEPASCTGGHVSISPENC